MQLDAIERDCKVRTYLVLGGGGAIDWRRLIAHLLELRDLVGGAFPEGRLGGVESSAIALLLGARHCWHEERYFLV